MLEDNQSGKVACEQRGWRLVHLNVRKFAGRQAGLDAEEAALIREVEAFGVWRKVGCATVLEYLERELGHRPKSGRERLRVARALGSLPELERSLASGALLYTAVRELTRVVTPLTERAWIERARGMNMRDLEELVSNHGPGDDPDDPPDPSPKRKPLVFDEVSPQGHALVRQVEVMLANELGHRLENDELVAMVFGAMLDGAGSRASERPSHQIAVTECKCGRAWQHGGGRKFELDAVALDRARCDATRIGSLDAEQPERAKADIPPATRRLVLHRDGGRCTYPGCRSQRFLDLHHVVHREHGGGHEPSNITCLCGAHHQQAHAGVFTISGQAPDALMFSHRDALAGIRSDEGCSPDLFVAPGATRADAVATPRKVAVRRTTGLDISILETQARDALVGLGYRAHQARDAVERAVSHVGHPPIAELIREALRRCGSATR